MQGAIPPHPTLLAFTNIKRTYKVMVDKATTPILGPGGVHAGLRAQFCEYAMRGSLAPYPTRLRSPSTNEGYTCPATVLNAGVFGQATRIRQYGGPIWRNTQCEAVRRRIPLGSGTQAPTRGKPVQRQYLMRVSFYSHSPIRGPNLANTQCEAVSRCISLGSGLQAPRRGKPVR